MLAHSKIKAQVLKSQDAEELRKTALGLDMVPLFDHGISLVLEGITTSAEVLRVTRIEEK
jgi:type II secretory ATPase GspE/PulE/Tfp pilus assembly ATPase PilB-like protein